jgi:hypothetical protein
MNDKDRLLFMKYALPCAGTLVKRGKITQRELDKLIEIVKNNEEIPTGAENIFKVAMAACTLIAKDSGRGIDSEIIRDYFINHHDEVIDKRFEEMKDFDPEACRIRKGKVLESGGLFVIVENSSGTGKFRTDFCKAKEGEEVITHWDFVVEKA